MFLLILESLGNSELLFILVMALVFFGPRKLPQISRSLGKNLAEFRRASEDFKRTWEREAALEESQTNSEQATSWQENAIMATEDPNLPLHNPIEPVSAEEAVAREAASNKTDASAQSTQEELINDAQSESLRKQDWL